MRYTGYHRPEMNLWKGRTDHASDRDFFRFHQVVKPLNLHDVLPDFTGKTFCLLGFASDEGVRRNQGRPGAADGPDAIRKGLASLPWHWDGVELYDAGDIACTDGDLEKAEDVLAEMAEKICRAGAFPIVLGGGHEVALGHFRGLKKYYGKGLGIINIDAHFDMRALDKSMSSGTMFAQIADESEDFRYFCLGIQKTGNTRALFKKADELGVKYLTADDLRYGADTEELDDFIERSGAIYLTLCFDVIASAFAPGVSAPQPFGLHPDTVRRLIVEILSSGRVVGFDIAEVAPKLDVDARTSKLAAHIIFYLIEHISEM